MGDEDESRYDAMVAFLGTFPTLSGAPPSDLAELGDGVAMFEALSEIAPEFFDPTTIARHLGDNWALKSSNLRKLLRNLESFYHEGLSKDADFTVFNLSAIARNSDRAAIADLVELIAAAAVTCENKGEFVGRIMSMPPENQAHMKEVITTSLSRLSDYEEDDDEGGDEVDENEMVFNDASASNMMSPVNLFSKDHLQTPEPETPKTLGSKGATSADRSELENALMDARRELAAHKSQATILAEDNENAQKKLRALVEDLQERLVKRQDELIEAEEELKNKTTALEDTKALAADLEEKNAQLADDLDVATAKAMQLRKAEATVVAYRNKLEGVGVMSQQMTELEDQAASYLRQIMDLEADVKKIPGLQKSVEELQSKVSTLEKEKTEADAAVKSKTTEVADLKSKLNAAESAKKMYEEELTELRAQDGGNLVEEDLASAVGGLSLTNAKTVTESKERTMRLEIENQKLREQVEQLQKGGAPSTAAAVSSVDNDDVDSLKQEVVRLREEVGKMDAEKKKLGADKEKLEAYTKKTLAKFQEKYLVALQECKAKLKEKQDKIEILEGRSASEKTAQKREERLLSSTIYELGLAMMQNRLKER